MEVETMKSDVDMSWKKVRINDICRPRQWKTLSMDHLENQGYPVYGANGIIGYYSEYTHEEPTLAITCRGATCGAVHITKPKSYINGNAMALDNISSEFDIKFLYYYFRYRGFGDVISGSAQPQITGEGLSKVEIPLPPLATQKRIAEILDAADALHRKDQELLKKYDELAQAIFVDMFGDPVKNEKGWEVGTIRNIVSDVKYGTSKPAEEGGQYPYLRMNNITYEGDWDFKDLKYINLDDKEKSKYLIKKGDLIFNRTNSKELVGKTAVYNQDNEMAIAGYLIRLRTNEKSNPIYISAYLNSLHGKKTLFGMCKSIIGMANINAQELQDIKILIPPIELQNKFAKIVSQIEKQRKKIAMLQTFSENVFEITIQKAFKGELVS